ncbi:hypothetical protein [Xanthocytophaga agilis]|uniref:Transposase n=1 Tax=Xanthocytophaga agilis TaxID=3048010 RepID=A0AAE3UFM3_9BACT|nr:hypothetical protein [Xanthocytophaga agilis]MDJ1503415.1 hypothetical protein [Xanthocytophaga agilis]
MKVEPAYAQLKDQFLIERNYVKSFDGFKTCILSKVLALSLVKSFNQLELSRQINHIKQPIF